LLQSVGFVMTLEEAMIAGSLEFSCSVQFGVDFAFFQGEYVEGLGDLVVFKKNMRMLRGC